MARAYERWPTVSRLDRPEGWVYRVAMNWALSFLRRRRRSDHRLYDPGADTTAISDPDVHAALGELDVKHRTVIVCRHLLGWSVAETAAALKVARRHGQEPPAPRPPHPPVLPPPPARTRGAHMSNDDRLDRYLADQANAITLPPADPTGAARRGARRRTRRRGA